jgi:hypothetical protein
MVIVWEAGFGVVGSSVFVWVTSAAASGGGGGGTQPPWSGFVSNMGRMMTRKG